MNNNKLWYLGYVIGIFSLILVFALKLNEIVNIILTFVFAICVSFSHTKIIHHKMIDKDYNYKISIKDERNEMIRIKVNATMTPILMLLMGIITAVCICVKAYLPATLLAIVILCSPLIMFFINKYYEKRY